MLDLRAEYLKALAHESGKAGPAFRRNHCAIDASLSRPDIDINSTREPHLRLTELEGRDALARNHAVNRDETCTPWQMVKIGFCSHGNDA